MHGLYVMWWVQEKHVPVAAVAIVLAAGDIFLTALEFPTGWLADRYGHRASLITGSLLQIAGMLFAWLGAGVPGVLASSLVIACGGAFRSGADQALLYRSCMAIERESDFQRIESRTRGLQLVALVAMVLAGGFIVETWGFAAGWIVETMVSIAGLAIACAMCELPAARSQSSSTTTNLQNDHDPAERSQSSSTTTSLQNDHDPAERSQSSSTTTNLQNDDPAERSRSIRTIWIHQNDRDPAERSESARMIVLWAVLVPAALLGAVGSATTFIAQASDLEPGRMTIVVAGVVLAEAAGSVAAGYVVASVRGQWTLGAFGAAIAVTGLLVPEAFLAAVAAVSFLLGLALPLRAVLIQRQTADGLRARAASFASACDKALTTIALVVAGALPSGTRRR